MRAESQEQEDRLLRIYNELLLACARKRRMEDATFLLHSADQHGLDLSLHHVQVTPGSQSVRRVGVLHQESLWASHCGAQRVSLQAVSRSGACICPGRLA